MHEAQQNLIGQIIAKRWQVIESLGHGFMSYVYKAQDVETGKIIILKLIKNNLLPKSIDLKNLEKQLRNFIALNHENIASYYNLYLTSDNQLFLFCDYLQGQSLATRLSKIGKLSIEQSIPIFQQVTVGLCYAHEKKIWHGDLRPSNVFIVNDQFTVDEAKIVDFGLMNLLESKQDQNSTTSLKKTFAHASYISPEQRAGQNIDQRCDLYALGCLMYETVTGKPPYIGANAMATAYKQQQQTTTALHEILPAHPLLSRYQTITSKLLKANRQERYQTASQLKADLDLITQASDNEWLKKANVLKQSTYSKLAAKRWQILASILILTLLTILAVQIINTISPYYQPWTGTDFDDSKLWLVQERQIPHPSISTIKEKYLLAGKLESLKKNKQESSKDYIQTLFAYSRVLLACGQWQEAQTILADLQKKDLKNTKIRPADVFANLALAYFMLSNLPAAEDYSNKALSAAGQDSSWTADKIIILKILGDLYTGRGEEKKAMAIYEQMHKLAWESRLQDASDYAYACALLADAYRKDKQYTEAEKLYKEAIDWGNNFIGQKQFFMAKAFYGLALTEYQLGKSEQAESQLQLALPIAIAHQSNNSKFVIAIKLFNDYLLFHQNLFAWAKQHWQQL